MDLGGGRAGLISCTSWVKLPSCSLEKRSQNPTSWEKGRSMLSLKMLSAVVMDDIVPASTAESFWQRRFVEK